MNSKLKIMTILSIILIGLIGIKIVDVNAESSMFIVEQETKVEKEVKAEPLSSIVAGIALATTDTSSFIEEEFVGEIEEEIIEENSAYIIASNYTSDDTVQDYILYAWSYFYDYGWSEYDLECLVALWHRESNWNPLAHNSSSGAHGIPQSLPADKMATHGADYWDNPHTQINWGLDYIYNRYGNPANAWYHSESVGWY